MIRIVEIRSDASNVVEDAVNRLSSEGLTMQFIDRLTLKVWNGDPDYPVHMIWFGSLNGQTKTVVVNRIIKELCDGKDA
jgi:hypothetical protein